MAAGAWDAQLPVGCQVFLIWRKRCSAQRSTWSVSFFPCQLDQLVSVLSLSLSQSVSPLVVLPGSYPGDREDIDQDSRLSYF